MTSPAGTVEIDGFTVEFDDVGTGPPIVFVHGAYVTGAVWADVTPNLSERYRCITPTWGFGAQRKPSRADVDFSVPASGRRIGRLLDLLDLHDVTLVANDTGGGIVLSALADPPEGFARISRLVFTNCDTFDKFPPPNFAPLVRLCRLSRGAGRAVMRVLATETGQRFFAAAVTESGIAPAVRAAIYGGFTASSAVRREATVFTAGLHSRYTLGAVDGMRSWTRPVLAVWGEEDSVLTVADARRLVSTFPDARLTTVPGGSTFVMLDQPERVAAAIDAFASSD